jgi:hypothetical protein
MRHRARTPSSSAFADESDDNHTYTLGGWAITPVHYGILSDSWRAMLQTIKLADGSPCPAFHASAMAARKPPFSGWEDPDAHWAFVRDAFDRATAAIEQHQHFAMQPFGVAAEIPASFTHVQRDSIWLMLFVNMFRMLFETHSGAMSIEFVFDCGGSRMMRHSRWKSSSCCWRTRQPVGQGGGRRDRSRFRTRTRPRTRRPARTLCGSIVPRELSIGASPMSSIGRMSKTGLPGPNDSTALFCRGPDRSERPSPSRAATTCDWPTPASEDVRRQAA